MGHLNISKPAGVEPRDQRHRSSPGGHNTPIPPPANGTLPSIPFPFHTWREVGKGMPKRQGQEARFRWRNKQCLQTRSLQRGSRTNASVYNKMSSLKIWSGSIYSTLWYVCFHVQMHNISEVTHISSDAETSLGCFMVHRLVKINATVT